MHTPAMAFFERSLSRSTRESGTYVMRLVLVVVLFALVSSVSDVSPLFGAPGLQLFDAIVRLNLGVICLAAPGLFGSVITEEKEAGTLGLLKMAGLNPVSILLGKSTSQLLVAVMLLLVQVPFTVLAVTLGGVSLQQVFAGYLAMIAFLLFTGNMALLFSVVSPNAEVAFTLCVAFLGAFFVGPPLWRGAIGGPVDPWFIGLVAMASPFNWIGQVMKTGFTGPLIGFQVVSNLALAGGFFLLAWAGFDRFTREAATAAPPRPPLTRHVGRLSALGAGRVWANALAWKDFNFQSGGKLALLWRFVVVGPTAAVVIYMHAAGASPSLREVGQTIAWVSLILMFAELALLADRIFGQERKWHTLTTVMGLPYTPWQVVRRKALGGLLCLLPYVVWLVAGAVLAGGASILGLGDAVTSFPAVTDFPFWLCVAFGVLYLHMIVYLSLTLRRGSFLAATVVTPGIGLLMVPIALVPALMELGEASVYITMLVELIGVTLVLQRHIADRLSRTGELE